MRATKLAVHGCSPVCTIGITLLMAAVFLGSIGCNQPQHTANQYSSASLPSGRSLYATKSTANLSPGYPASPSGTSYSSGRTLFATKDTSNLWGSPSPQYPSGGRTLFATKDTSPLLASSSSPQGRAGRILAATKNTSHLVSTGPAPYPSGPGSSPGIPSSPPSTAPGHEYGMTGSSYLAQADSSLDQGDHTGALAAYENALAMNLSFAEQALANFGRGQALMGLNRYQEAADAYTTTLTFDTQMAEAFRRRADAYRSLGQYEQAVADYSSTVALAPDHVEALNRLAWLSATCTDGRCLDGERAVEAAESVIALVGRGEPRYLDTLAAAYAEAKRFDQAVAVQEEAVRLLQQSGAGWLPEARARLELYRGFKPYRDRS
ncbi:MAG: hypothetical protein D6E12_06225 [Desulfovibrio sp.]|nr:MAG: hypothetical protein D6E12_06225 [Desulfovibrio sp.]